MDLPNRSPPGPSPIVEGTSEQNVLVVCLAGSATGTFGLAMQGFSAAGMPFSAENRVTGTAGKIAGGFCVAIAVGFAVSAVLVAVGIF